MITVWQGSCNQWDCDEMGHMNVRVYIEKQTEGLHSFAHHMAMPHAFRKDMPSTLIPVEQHIRYIREARPGMPLSMQACVLSFGDDDVWVYQDMRHADGKAAAAFRTRLVHAEVKTGRAFPWSIRSKEALKALMDTPPDDTAPRSFDLNTQTRPLSEITQDVVNDVGAPMIGTGVVPVHHLDIHGRMSHHWFIGRLSDSVPNLLYTWRQRVAEIEDTPTGGAVLEYRIKYHAFPKAGDRWTAYSSIGEIKEKTHSIVHWMMNPDTGTPWMTSEAVAITMDLQKRKAIATSPERKKEIAKIAPAGLTI